MRTVALGLLFGLAVSTTLVAQSTNRPDEESTGKPTTDVTRQFKQELEQLKAEVERLKRNAQRDGRGIEPSPEAFMRSPVGQPGQTDNLRPGEALRFSWDSKPVDSPAISPNGEWGFVSSSAGSQQRLLDLRHGRELAFSRPKHYTNVKGAFSPNNRLLAVYYFTGDVDVYSLVERKLVAEFNVAGDGGLMDLQFTPDSKRLIAARGGTISQYDVEQGQQIARLQTPMDSVLAVALSDDAKLGACAGGFYNNTVTAATDVVRVWDLATDKILFRIQPQTRSMANYIRLLPGNERLVVHLSSRTSIFSVSENRELFSISPSGGARFVAASPDGKLLASGNYDKGLQIWNLSDGRLLHTFVAETSGFRGIAWAADGKHVLSTGQDGTARLWKLPSLTAASPETALPPAAKTLAPTSISASPATPRLSISVSELPSAPLPRDVSKLERLEAKMTRIGDNITYALAYLPGGKHLLSGGFGGQVRLLDATTGEELNTAFEKDSRRMPINAIAVEPGGKWAVFAGGQTKGTARIIVWDLVDWKERFRTEGHEHSVSAVCVSPDSKTIYSASLDQTIRAWDAETGASQRVWKEHPATVSRLAVSPSGRHLVSVDAHGSACVWSLPEGRLEKELKNLGHVGSIAFTDERTVVFGHQDSHYVATRWNLSSGKPIFAWSGQGAGTVATSADGRWLVISGREAPGFLWDLQRERFSAALPGWPARMRPTLALSSDGKKLAAAGYDDYLRMWDLPTAP
jgi:WD40 repeat protein